MACGEFGEGRMAEPTRISDAIDDYFHAYAPLAGRHAIVTSGPTHEAIDPVRYIANRSSCGNGTPLIASALAARGARTTLVTGPTHEPNPAGVKIIRIQSARDMLNAVLAALPADIAICAAAVADWRQKIDDRKMKKTTRQLRRLISLKTPISCAPRALCESATTSSQWDFL